MPISGCRTENCVVFEENRTAEKKIALSIEEIRRRKKRTKYNKENARHSIRSYLDAMSIFRAADRLC